MNEVWKDIKGYKGLYQVSNFGRVKSVDRYRKRKDGTKTCEIFFKGKLLKERITNSGYIQVEFGKNGKRHFYNVHRLVAETFIPNPRKLPEVNHKNEDKTDNRVSNLEWCSRHYNINYGTGIYRRSIKNCNSVTLIKSGQKLHFHSMKAAAKYILYKSKAKCGIDSILANLSMVRSHYHNRSHVYGYRVI